jgi:hypothetical protein
MCYQYLFLACLLTTFSLFPTTAHDLTRTFHEAINNQDTQLFKQAISDLEIQATLGKAGDVNLAEIFNHLASSMPSRFWGVMAYICGICNVLVMVYNISYINKKYNLRNAFLNSNPQYNFNAHATTALIMAIANFQSAIFRHSRSLDSITYSEIIWSLKADNFEKYTHSIIKELAIGIPITFGFLYLFHRNIKGIGFVYQMTTCLLKTITEKNIPYDSAHLCDKAQQLIATIKNQM